MAFAVFRHAVVAVVWRPAAMAQGADYKIGFVNSERLFRDATPAKRAQQKLEKEFAGRDAEIQKLAKQVRDLQTMLEKDGVTMAETERRNKERDLANMTRDLQRGQREFREDLNLRRNEELSAVQERANKVIQQIAIDEKFDLIIQDPGHLRQSAHRHHRSGDQGARRQIGRHRGASAHGSTSRRRRDSLGAARGDPGARLVGDGAVLIRARCRTDDAGPGAIAFLANPKYRRQLATTGASCGHPIAA